MSSSAIQWTSRCSGYIASCGRPRTCALAVPKQHNRCAPGAATLLPRSGGSMVTAWVPISAAGSSATTRSTWPFEEAPAPCRCARGRTRRHRVGARRPRRRHDGIRRECTCSARCSGHDLGRARSGRHGRPDPRRSVVDWAGSRNPLRHPGGRRIPATIALGVAAGGPGPGRGSHSPRIPLKRLPLSGCLTRWHRSDGSRRPLRRSTSRPCRRRRLSTRYAGAILTASLPEPWTSGARATC
jgi:hypothetical protein